jgi:uncharacterized membrane protein YraQ (UPF0718 family)
MQSANAAPGRPPPPARRLIDRTVWFFVVLAIALAGTVLAVRGVDALQRALAAALGIISVVAPMIAIGLYLGGLARELADPARVAPALGERSGLAGLALATGLGAVTPGGPFAAFPIVYALFLAGADAGAVIAYLTAWSVIGLHRIVVWELPLLGHEFAAVRVLASLPLPLIAGALARLIARGPLAVSRPPAPPPGGAGGAG